MAGSGEDEPEIDLVGSSAGQTLHDLLDGASRSTPARRVQHGAQEVDVLAALNRAIADPRSKDIDGAGERRIGGFGRQGL